MRFYSRNPSKFELDIQMLKSDMWLAAAIWIMQAAIRNKYTELSFKSLG